MKEKLENYKDNYTTEEKLQNAIDEISLQNEVIHKRAKELIIANKERVFESKEKAARAEELAIANKELIYQNKEKEKRAAELVLANKKLLFENEEKEKRAAELMIANKELVFQNEEKKKRADELIIANKELVFQNEEKEKRADELIIANRELAFQNEEKHKRAEEFQIANKELASLNTEQQALFASIVNSSEDAMLSKSLDGIITSWNHGAEKIFGYQPNEIIGKHVFILIPEHLQNGEVEIANKIKNGETVKHYETERVKKDGTIFNASLSISPIMDWKGNIKGASKILRDVTSNVIAEKKLIKSNRMYAFISSINQMIVKATDETSLFNQACSIAVDIGKFKMGWIGMIDEATKMVIPLVHAGEEGDYLTKMIPVSIEDIPGGRGPVGKSLRQSKYVVCNDIENDPQMVPWKENAAERGYLSCIALPLRKFGKVVGSYTLYAPVKNFFDDAEIALLDEAAHDISYALESLEKEALHKKAEDKIIESEKEVRTMAESMPQIVWVTTAEGKNIYFNQQWVDYTGLTLEQSHGDGWLIPLHKEDKPIAWDAWNKAIANQGEYNVECRLQKYDGTYHWYLLRGIPKINEEGEILKWYGTCTDIEKIKQAEIQIRKSEVFNRSVLNSISAHMAVVTDQGEIISVNGAWTRFAMQNGETSMERTGVGSNYFKVCEKASISGDTIAAQVLQAMKDVFNNKIKDFYIEYPCHSPSEKRWFGLRITKFESDEPLILLVHRNHTERILAELHRQKITDDLIYRNQNLEQFTYIVSHNLRAPVANIKGLSDILGDESLSKEESDCIVKDLLTTVNKLDTVILDLNNILQLKSNAGETKERVVFAELVFGIKESIHTLVLRENVKIVTQFDEVAEMISLKSYLYSIFYNLINNSIKYKRQDVHPVIEIKSIRRKDNIELIFKDNGRGIDLNKNGGQIFGLYKRFHWDVEGKGVGLFSVKTQIEALGGKISIESEVDKGTEFKILFAIERKHDN